MLRLATALAEQGARTDLVLAQARGRLMPLVPERVRVVDLGARSPVVVTKTLGLARYLRRERPRAVLSALDVVNTALLARRMARVPSGVVLTVHTHLSRQFRDKPDHGVARLRRALIRMTYPRTERLVAVSRGVADDAARIAGLTPSRVQVIPNPVVTDELREAARRPVEHPFLAPGEPPVVLGVGRFVRQKDFPTLVSAFALVRERRPARLIILGEPDPREPGVRETLVAQVEHAGLGADVSLPGFADNPYAYMARSAVLALSSIYEGLPTVLVEALAVGTTIVATDCESGPREILEGGRLGALVPVGDAPALADAIVAALDRPADPDVLRAAADKYTAPRVAREYRRAIEAAAARASSGS